MGGEARPAEATPPSGQQQPAKQHGRPPPSSKAAAAAAAAASQNGRARSSSEPAAEAAAPPAAPDLSRRSDSACLGARAGRSASSASSELPVSSGSEVCPFFRGHGVGKQTLSRLGCVAVNIQDAVLVKNYLLGRHTS